MADFYSAGMVKALHGRHEQYGDRTDHDTYDPANDHIR